MNPTADVQAVLDRVRARYGGAGGPVGATSASTSAPPAAGDGLFATVDEAVDAAWEAFQAYKAVGLDGRHRIVDAVRQAMREHGESLARHAHAETGLGRAEDKIKKNRLVTEKTPGPEDLEPKVWSGDRGLTVVEYAPFGVVAAITPTTNPTATIINNTIAVTSAGNGLVFNVHPNAKRVSAETIRILNRAMVAAGAPRNLITGITEPTLESAQALMAHPKARILLVTGGPGVVKAALATQKRAITAGPGNPPVVVDPTADIAHAAAEIVRGASFDNNVICTDEKEIFVVQEVADALLKALSTSGAVIVPPDKIAALEKVIFKEMGAPMKPGKINPKWIGQNAGKILGEIGIAAGDDVRLAVMPVPVEHSLIWTEQMMPVMPVATVESTARAIDFAVRAEHGFGHTASIYSRDVTTITEMARRINVSIFVANAANLAGLADGGEGYTSFSIASPTGEGLTRPRSFSRERRLTVAGGLRIV